MHLNTIKQQLLYTKTILAQAHFFTDTCPYFAIAWYKNVIKYTKPQILN